MYAQGGSSTSPTKLSNGSKEGSSSGKTKEAKREGKEKLKVMLMMLISKMMKILMLIIVAGVKTTSRDKTTASSFGHSLSLPTGGTHPIPVEFNAILKIFYPPYSSLYQSIFLLISPCY